MLSYQEQFSNATRTQFEAAMQLVAGLATTTFEGVEKMVDLNMSLVRSTLEESSATVQQLVGAKDLQSFLSLGASQAQPGAEKALSYMQNLAAITSSISAEYARAAEARIADNQRQLFALVEEVGKNAPAGSENAIAFFRSALDNASAGYAQLSSTTKQAVEAMESNIANVASQVSQSVPKASRGRKAA